MKLSDFTRSLSPLEIATLVLFIIYIVFPFRTPAFLSGAVNTPLGLIGVLIITLYLFFYTNPILGVVYIFVAYELLRRSALVKSGGADNYLLQTTPSEIVRTQEMVQLNPPRRTSLEEDVIANMAPSQVFHYNPESESAADFKPVAELVVGASLYK